MYFVGSLAPPKMIQRLGATFHVHCSIAFGEGSQNAIAGIPARGFPDADSGFSLIRGHARDDQRRENLAGSRPGRELKI
jgi:hypothetical protein